MPGTRKLGRETAHRKAMLRNLTTSLLENGKMVTTETRAKEVRCMAEKMITLGKKNTLHTRRQALAYITKEDVPAEVIEKEKDILIAQIKNDPKMASKPKAIQWSTLSIKWWNRLAQNHPPKGISAWKSPKKKLMMRIVRQ